MANPSDKWSRLQDHETPPPGDAYERLRGQLFLSRLQQHSVPPPSSVSASVKDAVRQANTANKSIPRRIPVLRWLAAACVGLILAGGIIYWAISNRSAHSTIASSGRKQSQPVARTVAPVTASDSAGRSPVGHTDSSSEKTAASGTTILHGSAGIPLAHPAIEGHPLALVDNDLMVTFTSFRYPEIADYIGQEGEYDLRIHVDQYTNITLSPTMAGFIKEMYSYRKNGKPTRKARKTKERLERWQAADQKQFDSSARSNPVDPFDLGDFLFR